MNSPNDMADTLVALTAEVAAEYLGNNAVPVDDIENVIRTIYRGLAGLSDAAPAAAPVALPEPAVPIRLSVKPDYLICLEDGRKMKMLKRHLLTRYGMTPDQYRAKWSLPTDYPMVAPNYAEQRRMLAKSIGLGTRRTRAG